MGVTNQQLFSNIREQKVKLCKNSRALLSCEEKKKKRRKKEMYRQLLLRAPPTVARTAPYTLTISVMSMHHIYCETKKEVIVQKAEELSLTGLFVFGKPGAVVVEGTAESIDEYERSLRRLRWQKFQVQGRCQSPLLPTFAGFIDNDDDGNRCELGVPSDVEEDIIEDPVTGELKIIERKRIPYKTLGRGRWHVVGGRLFQGFQPCGDTATLLERLREAKAPTEIVQHIARPFCALRTHDSTPRS